MVTRQRRGRARPDAKDLSSSVSPSQGRPSRLSLLLTILALTTSLLVALQISRFQNGKANIAIDRLLSSIGKSTGRSQVLNSNGRILAPDGEVDALKRRLGAIGKQFQDEIAKVKQTIQTSHQGGKDAAEGMSVVPGENIEDHSAEQDKALKKVPHIAEKSDEEAAEDQKIGLQDLDQETLKAMFDALYSRD